MDMIDVEEVVGIAHEEGYQEAATTVLCQCEETITKNGVVTLHELAALLVKRIYDVYIPLLFLMSEGKLTLWQEEFFGEIMVRSCRAE